MFHRFSIVLLVALILVVFTGGAMACGSCLGGLDAFSVCTLSVDPPSADGLVTVAFNSAELLDPNGDGVSPAVTTIYATPENAEMRGAALYSYTSSFGQSGNLVNYSVAIDASGAPLHRFIMG